jgi:hypothetical protein
MKHLVGEEAASILDQVLNNENPAAISPLQQM